MEKTVVESKQKIVKRFKCPFNGFKDCIEEECALFVDYDPKYGKGNCAIIEIALLISEKI